MTEKPSFERYDAQKHLKIKDIESVVDVVAGQDIDIIVLKKQDGNIQFGIDAVKEKLAAIGVDIGEVAFMYEGQKSILNQKPTEHGGTGTLLTFGQVGTEALQKLHVLVDSIVPASLMNKATYSAPDVIAMNGHLQALHVNPADIQVGAKFLIITESESQYVLTVNEDGLFEIKDDEINLQKPKTIGFTFVEFNNRRQLVGSKANTSPVKTMRKL